MRIGVDLGGTRIEAIALARDGRELLRGRRPTPAGDYACTPAAVAEPVDELERQTGHDARVGVGTSGSPSPDNGLIRNANSLCLNGRSVQQDLEEALGRPVRLGNDAECFALAEATDGAVAGAASVFGVIIGTGTGGGIVVEGRLVPPRHSDSSGRRGAARLWPA